MSFWERKYGKLFNKTISIANNKNILNSICFLVHINISKNIPANTVNIIANKLTLITTTPIHILYATNVKNSPIKKPNNPLNIFFIGIPPFYLKYDFYH